MSWRETIERNETIIIIAILVSTCAGYLYWIYTSPCIENGCKYTNRQGVVIYGDCDNLTAISRLENKDEVIDGQQMVYINWDTGNSSTT